ncbi:MAG: helix-turn-helix domain-containing protein, partial [Cellulosilyticaceae bacterium]
GLNPGLIDTFTQFFQTLKTCPDADLPYLLCEAQKIIYTLYTHTYETPSKEKQFIDLACSLLKNNATSRLHTEELCNSLGMGYEKFRKLFKLQVGLSPTQYRIQCRINLAKTLLLTSDSSIEQLAYELGYIDPYTFSKQFKKFTGLAPLEFKKFHY